MKILSPHIDPFLASSVYVLLMTSQSIEYDVTMQLRDLTIVTRAREKRYLTVEYRFYSQAYSCPVL